MAQQLKAQSTFTEDPSLKTTMLGTAACKFSPGGLISSLDCTDTDSHMHLHTCTHTSLTYVNNYNKLK